MAAFEVPIATGLFTGIPHDIATAPGAMLPGQGIGNLADAYWSGQNQAYLQRNRDLFKNGIPSDLSTALLQAGGASAVPEYVALQKLKLGQDLNTPIPGEYGTPYAANSSAGVATSPAASTATAPAGPAPAQGPTLRQIAEYNKLDPAALAREMQMSPDDTVDMEAQREVLTDAARKVAGAARGPQTAAAGETTTVPAATPAATIANRFPSTTSPLGTPFPPSVGAPNQARPQSPPAQVAQPPVAQAQAGPPVDAQVVEMNRQRRIADEAFKRGRAAAAIGDDALAKQFNSRAEAASNVANDINKSLLERAQVTGAQKEARDPAIAARNAQNEVVKADVAGFDKNIGSARTLASTAITGLQRVEDMKNLTLEPNYYSGPLAKGVQTYRQYQAAFGRDPSSAQPIEAFNKGVKDIVTEQIRGLSQSGVGRIVLAEVKNIQSAVASPDNSPAGNRSQLETLRRAYVLQQGLGQVANQVANEVARGQVPLGQYRTRLSELSDAWAQAHPLFTRQEIAQPTLIGAPDAPDGYTRLPKVQAQAWSRQHGVRPGEPLRMSDGSYIGSP